MTPSQKALEIFQEMYGYEGVVYKTTAKSIANYCAEQCREATAESLKEYWTEVIAEIEKL
jgi:hypothetical protein